MFLRLFFLCVLDAVPPLPAAWPAAPGDHASGAVSRVDCAVGPSVVVLDLAQHHDLRSPDGGGTGDDPQEDVALDAAEHSVRVQSAYVVVSRPSGEQALPISTYRPPRRSLV